MIFGLRWNMHGAHRAHGSAIAIGSSTTRLKRRRALCKSEWVSGIVRRLPLCPMFMLHNFRSKSTYFYNVHKCLNFYVFLLLFVCVAVPLCLAVVSESFLICEFSGRCVCVCLCAFLRLCLPLHSFSLFIIIIFGFGIDTIRSKRNRARIVARKVCVYEANRVSRVRDVRRTRKENGRHSIELNVGLSAHTITVITSINFNATFPLSLSLAISSSSRTFSLFSFSVLFHVILKYKLIY